jgi:hypothetical protein
MLRNILGNRRQIGLGIKNFTTPMAAKQTMLTDEGTEGGDEVK